ncbi:MAG: GAF domain-containing protein [Chloroflexota bacterium]
MSQNTLRDSFLTRLLARWERHYLWRVTLAFQTTSLLAAGLGIYYIVLNAGLSEEQFARLAETVFGLVGIANLLVFLYGRAITPNARSRLAAWAQAQKAEIPLLPQPEQEEAAWREVTAYPWRFTRFSVLISFFQVILPAALYLYWLGGFSLAQSIHVVIGGVIAANGLLLFFYFALEWALEPVRAVLVPSDAERQHNGLQGIRLQPRLLMVFLSIGTTTLLMVAALAYQKALRLTVPGADTAAILRELQIQLMGIALAGLILTIGLSYLLARSVATPINRLRAAMSAVEQGKLNQRAEVTFTDEIGHLSIAFNTMMTQLEALQSTLEQQVKERTKQLTATVEVGRVASSILDIDHLLDKVVNLITDRFGYYYTAIYLIDPSEKWAELREATGQAGSVLKQNRHRIEISGKSMVADCIREKMPRIAQNATTEKQRFENPLLPYTRSEIALPLMVGERILGVLNVHSTKAADFDTEIIETMQNVASQIAIALENARLFQEVQQSIRELQAIQKQYLFEGWTSVKSYNDALEYEIGEPSEAANQILQSVIELRNQVFGQITLEGHAEWTPEQRSLVDAVAAQAAIALENARLVAESRQIALRERALAEINSKIWAAGSVDNILQTVVKELGKRLDASGAAIELKLDENP